MRTTDERTKASSYGGKVHDKDKGIIAQSTQHNRNVLINERSIKNKEGGHRGIKGRVIHYPFFGMILFLLLRTFDAPLRPLCHPLSFMLPFIYQDSSIKAVHFYYAALTAQ